MRSFGSIHAGDFLARLVEGASSAASEVDGLDAAARGEERLDGAFDCAPDGSLNRFPDLAPDRTLDRAFDDTLEQDQSHGAVEETIDGGLFLRKTPLTGSAPGYFDSDSAVDRLGGKDVESELDRQILSYSQRFDSQTGLLNHQAIQDALARMLRNRAEGREVALIWIDLVNLRREFSLWGWTGAEALARRVAATLRSVVDAKTLLGRVGGRSFLVAMEGSKHDKAARQRLQAVVDALTPARGRGVETRPEVVAGVAFYPVDTESVEDLVRFASLAATRAGSVKSKSVVAFHAGMNSLIVHDHALETEMRKGLDEGQFSMVYQPKVDLAKGEILGAEALIRWEHPHWGAVTPGEFIPIAERSDLIHRIFDMGFRTALEQVQRWHEMGLRLPLIAVNISAANVRSDEFARSVQAIMDELPVRGAEVELEMTESLAFEDEALFTARMRQLKTTGVRIAIDDFGTRYTGFNVLKHLPLDTMKIDRCFVRGIDHSPGMRSLCETIVAMARQLKLRTVAEGIEEAGELEVMREIGCDAGQGYLFQRPVPADGFAEFLREWKQRRYGFGFTGGHRMQFQDTICDIA